MWKCVCEICKAERVILGVYGLCAIAVLASLLLFRRTTSPVVTLSQVYILGCKDGFSGAAIDVLDYPTLRPLALVGSHPACSSWGDKPWNLTIREKGSGVYELLKIEASK